MFRKPNANVLWVCVLIFCGGSFFLHGSGYGVELVGQWDEVDVHSLFIKGDNAYLGCGKDFIILDISKKRSPVKVGEITVTENVSDIYVSGNYAYIVDSYTGYYGSGDEETGLRIVDVSNPSAPKQVAFYADPVINENANPIRSVMVSGNYAYLGTGFAGSMYSYGNLVILDISNPASPQFRGSCQSAFISDVYVSGNYAYNATFTQSSHSWSAGGFNIMDISNPTAPLVVGRGTYWGTTGDAAGVHAAGGYAYVALRDQPGKAGIKVLDVSDPAAFFLGTTYTTPGTAEDVYVSGDFVYIADGCEGLRVVYSSKPYGLYELAYYDTCVEAVFADGEYVYTGSEHSRFMIFKLHPDLVSKARISIDKTQLYFGAVQGSSTTTAPQQVSIVNTGVAAMNWNASTNAGWLIVTPQSGSGDGLVGIGVNAGSLLPGTYTAKVTITANATNSPQKIDVSLIVHHPGEIAPAFGFFETPQVNATVAGSIPVTGWALHAIGVDNVKIYREPLPGEGNNLIYIGDAIFVEGARPDVEAAYPGYPMNSRAGWGYMLLTNFLPNSGNGRFTLHAIATTLTGDKAVFGARTINCDNAHAEKPFGALDTPAQGGIASGNNYVNWGWVLTPQPDMLLTDGSGIFVVVDGCTLGHPTYNIYRSDIAGLFPGYSNTNGAAGYFLLDTTPYANGLHTIEWVARDTGGRYDGIGSRYFSIQNSSQDSGSQTQSTANLRVRDNSLWPVDALTRIPCETAAPVTCIKGFPENSTAEEIYPDEYGIITIESRELERIEISLTGAQGLTSMTSMPSQPTGAKNSANLPGYSGRLLVGNRLKPLPVGSVLDTERGVFCWGPGPGFVGLYELVFFDQNQGRLRKVNIKINPKY